MTEERKFVDVADAQAPFFVGVDLGGTNIKIGVIDDLGQPMAWLSIPTEVPNGPHSALERMAEGVRDAVGQAKLGIDQIARIGLGAPGTLDIPAGLLFRPNNLKGWDNFPIRDLLAEATGVPTTFANDASAAAYGEYWVGAGQKFQSMIQLTLGTGLGTGIIIDGVSIDGDNSHGGECGHLVINPSNEGRWCNCGKQGHLEAYVSATAVIRRTQEMLEAFQKTSIRDRIAEGAKLTPKLVGQEAAAGDPLAMKIIMDTARYLGVGANIIATLVRPRGILIGGAMTFGGNGTELGRKFLATVQAEVDRLSSPHSGGHVELAYSLLGGDAGYIGAAGMARDEYMKIPA